jgi:hypothetical protein
MDSSTVAQIIKLLKADNRTVQQTLAQLRARGFSEKDADEEIARAFVGCLLEHKNGKPNRFVSVLAEIGAGRSAIEIFADGQ